MAFVPKTILSILDRCCDAFAFPMLDNGYVYLAGTRLSLLATPHEGRVSVLPEMEPLLQLEEWHHPNVVDDKGRPSTSETFRQLAQVLATGDVSLYHPSQPPNTHWRNWPEGGSL